MAGKTPERRPDPRDAAESQVGLGQRQAAARSLEGEESLVAAL